MIHGHSLSSQVSIFYLEDNYALLLFQRPSVAGLRDGALVRVVGNLREFDGKVHLLVFDVTPVLDWNELSYHLLDIMLTHCQQTKGSIPVASSPIEIFFLYQSTKYLL